MANAIKQRIELGITNSEGRKGILTLRTGKGFRKDIRSDAKVVWADGQCESFLLFGDYDKCIRTTPGIATQMAIDKQHAAVFTPDVAAGLIVEAKAFYAAKAVAA